MIIGNAIGIGFTSSSSEEEIDPRDVATFNGGTSKGVAGARDLDYEITSSNLAISIEFWIKGSNLSKLAETPLTVTDATRAQWVFSWVGENNTSVPRKLQFLRVGSSTGSIFQQVQSTSRLLRNRWYHVVVTSAEGASNGLKMYINSVEETNLSATGTFVNSYSTANMRLRIGSDRGDTNFFRGKMCNIRFWNRVLTQSEVTELYNNGVHLDDASGLSFYADAFVDQFSCTENLTSSDGVALTETSMTYAESRVSANRQNISFRKHADANTAYVAFGGLIHVDAKEYAAYVRTGTEHVDEGNLLKVLFDGENLRTAPTLTTAITEASTQHVSGVAIGKTGENVIALYSRYNDSTGNFVETGRRVSSDGLTGESFDAMTTMTTEYSRYEFYEKVIAGFSAGEYFASFFEHDGAGTYRFSVFKTTDNWATVSKIQVFEDDTIRLAEAALVKLPNTLLAIARDQGASGGLWQTYSTDGGDTWSSPQKTNLVAEGVANASMCLNDNGKIDILYVSREFHEIYLSIDNDPATILADETAWNEGTLINNAYATDGLGILGYPSILNAGGNYRAMMFSTEFSTTRADLFVGYGLIDEL